MFEFTNKINTASIPLKFQTLVIHIAAIQNQQNISTTILSQIECKVPYHLVYRGKTSYCDVRSTDASIKDLTKRLNICKLHKPTKNIEVIIHHPPSFFLMTRQSHVYSNTVRNIFRILKSTINNLNIPVTISLGDSKLYEQFYVVEISTNKSTIHFDDTIYSIDQFIQEQYNIRKELCLIKI